MLTVRPMLNGIFLIRNDEGSKRSEMNYPPGVTEKAQQAIDALREKVNAVVELVADYDLYENKIDAIGRHDQEWSISPTGSDFEVHLGVDEAGKICGKLAKGWQDEQKKIVTELNKYGSRVRNDD